MKTYFRIFNPAILGFIFCICISLNGSYAQCPNNLLTNGSFTSLEGEDVVAPGWTRWVMTSSCTPDVNDEFGTLNTTSSYDWTGLPIGSTDGGTWQNLFGPTEKIYQQLQLKIGHTYLLTFEYTAQGIENPSFIFEDPVGIEVQIDSVPIYSTPLDVSQYTWENASYTFTASDSSVIFSFQANVQQYVALDGACLVDLTTGYLEVDPTLFNVQTFPNPAKDQLTINSNVEMHHGVINIINSNGQLILSDIFASGKSKTIDISKLQSGIYYLNLIQSDVIYDYKKVLIFR